MKNDSDFRHIYLHERRYVIKFIIDLPVTKKENVLILCQSPTRSLCRHLYIFI